MTSNITTETGGSGYNYRTVAEADPLDAFAFEPGDLFVRCWPGRLEEYLETVERADVWRVTGRRFQYRVGWLPERDSVPTREQHRRYDLTNYELAETEVTEWALATDFVQIDESDLPDHIPYGDRGSESGGGDDG